MSLRRTRLHQYGYSNIDYRTKQDMTSIDFYQPWIHPKNFGTMGCSGYVKLKTPKVEKIMRRVNSTKNITSQLPDPKTFSTAKFYNDNKIKYRSKSNIRPVEPSHLDESEKGKDAFTGDSMMIADTRKARKLKKDKKKEELKEKINVLKIENIIKDKTEKNKEANQETQLVKIEAEETLEGKVNLEKLKEIRLAIRRRYANRTNLKQIFRDWNQGKNGEISLYEAHSMINSFGIPINFNETRALIATANPRGTESLNMTEFTNLIFDDNSALEVDLKRIKFKDEKLLEDEKQMSILNEKLQSSVEQSAKEKEVNFLEEFFRLKLPRLFWAIKDYGCSSELIDYNSYLGVLKYFSLPQKYKAEEVIKGLFDKYSIIENGEKKMNVKNFAEICVKRSIENSSSSFNSDLKNKNFEKLQAKMKEEREEIKKYDELLMGYRMRQKKILQGFKDQIEEKKKRLSKSQIYEHDVNSCQPSTEFIKKMFKGNAEYNKKFEELEKSFSSLPSLMGKIKGKTRSGANPPPKNTFVNFQPEKSSPMYISEEERFKVRSLNDKVEYIKKEKEKKEKNDKERLRRIIQSNKKIEEYKNELENKSTQLNISCQLTKSKNIYDYEFRNKFRNDLIE